MTTALFPLVLAAATAAHLECCPGKSAADQDISALAWLAGTWAGTDGKMEMEEVWLPPKGGAMLGVHRDVVGDKMVSFEFLRIASRPNAIAYIASPNGSKPTVFPMKECSEERAVFENLEHDFPKRILYWLEKDGALHARIEGDKDSKEPPMEWTWRRADAGK